MDPAATLGYVAFFVVAGTALLYYGTGKLRRRTTSSGTTRSRSVLSPLIRSCINFYPA